MSAESKNQNNNNYFKKEFKTAIPIDTEKVPLKNFC
jgi:hypothetical protein